MLLFQLSNSQAFREEPEKRLIRESYVNIGVFSRIIHENGTFRESYVNRSCINCLRVIKPER